jgi:hypothetical protein
MVENGLMLACPDRIGLVELVRLRWRDDAAVLAEFGPPRSVMKLPAPTMRRLAFIKYLHATAEHQAIATDLLSASAVLSLHDAVEIYLLLACEHCNATPRDRPDFADYWKALAQALHVSRLPEQTAMRRLNMARIALKHHGQLPAAGDVEGYRFTVSSFFEDATPLLFGIEFKDVSMADFIQPESARLAHLRADRLLSEGNFKEAAEELAIGFERMVKHYTKQAVPEQGRHVFRFDGYKRPILGRPMSRLVEPAVAAEILRAVAEIQQSLALIGPISDALRIIALGLDFRKYARFVSLMPMVANLDQDRPWVQWRGNLEQALTIEYVQFCLAFMIECAIALGAFDDVGLKAPNAHTGAA